MKWFRRMSLLFYVLAVYLVVGSIVLAATWEYKFPTSITDTSGAARTQYPVLLDYTGQTFIDGGFTVNGSDTNMQYSTTDVKYIMSTTQVASVVSNLPASGTVTHDLYTGYSPAPGMSIVTGDGGYVTVTDHASIELGQYWQIDFTDAYLNTGTSAYLLQKSYALDIYTGSGNVTANIYNSANLTPDGTNDPATAWTDDALAIDNDTGTRAVDSVAATTYSEYLEFTLTDNITASGAMFFTLKDATRTTVDVDLYNGSWHNIYSDTAHTSLSWYTIDTLPTVYTSVSKARMRVYNASGGGADVYIYEFKFMDADNVAATVTTAVSAGEHDISVSSGNVTDTETQSTEVNSLTIYNGANSSSGERINSLVASYLTQFDVVARKVGAPTGTGNLTMRRASDNALIGILDNLDVSTLTTSFATVSFTGSVANTVTQDVRITFDYNDASSNATNYVQLRYAGNLYADGVLCASNTIPGTGDLAAFDLTFEATFEVPTLALSVDSVEEDSANIYGISVPDNSDNWTILQSGASPYCDVFSITVGGAQVTEYDPLVMLSAATLADNVGSNDGTITWGSNTSVTIAYGAMSSSANTSYAQAAQHSMTIPTQSIPSTWFASGAGVANLPFYEVVNQAATATGITPQTWYVIFLAALAFIAAAILGGITQSGLIFLIVADGILFMGSSMTIIPMWIPFSVAIASTGLIFLKGAVR